MFRFKRAPLPTLIALCLLPWCGLGAGCATDTFSGRTIETYLADGQTEEAVLLLLSERARATVGEVLPRPESGDWSEVIDNIHVSRTLKELSEPERLALWKYMRVGRNYGLTGYDTFHLFFSRDERLVVHLVEIGN
jgi:hypothetical protein